MDAATACPAEDALLRNQLGELSVNDSALLAAHLPGCSTCRQRALALAQLVDELQLAARAVPADGDRFRRRVTAALDAPAAVAPPRPAWPLLALAAAVALVPVVTALQLRGALTPGPSGQFNSRGQPSPQRPTRAEVLLVRGGQLLPVAGQTLRATDALAVRVANGGARPLYLMSFGLDAAGEVHWLYPAYEDPASDPGAVRIDARSPLVVLDQIYTPDRPAAGTLRLYTLLLPAPLTVRAVERRLAVYPGGVVPDMFPGAVLGTHTARWGAR